MALALRIHRDRALTVTLSGLSSGQAALLQEIILTTEHLDRPASENPGPGIISLHGSALQLLHCLDRVADQREFPDHLRSLLISQLDNYLRSDYKIVLKKDRVLDLGSRTHIMGILNVTPDSFSDGGQFADRDRAVAHARDMASQGADIIDIGGESTRPGSQPLTEDEELRRVIPVIERLSDEIPVPLSIDTYKTTVAGQALRAGASLVNDISGLRFSPDMAKVIADEGAAVVLMHIKGTPRDMQKDPVYEDVIREITDSLHESIDIALRAGIPRNKILIDPGIGFGKTVEHNLIILRRLDELRILGCPLVLGTSRKRFIGTVLGSPEPKDRIEGTAATVALGIDRGAHIVRVHDVGEMVRVARMTDAIVRAGAKEQAPDRR